jgi:pimeloyl-ACP methyl ester carboxylesterase
MRRLENTADNVTLAGTLTMPSGDGPFPAVVLVSGSGPQDRDESLLGHKPFWVIADHLSRQGIAVLRYDDRGMAKSTGSFSNATTVDFANDARCAVEFLRGQPKIDPSRVGIVGHSEGGLVASILCASDLQLAHVVLLAGPGVPGDKILATQTRAIMAATELQGVQAEKQLKITQDVVDAVKRGVPAAEFKTMIQQFSTEQVGKDLQSDEAREAARQMFMTQLQQLGGPWFEYFLKYDPSQDLRRATCPVLALIGELDLQVVPDVNLPVIREALSASGRHDFRCTELEGLNHLFQTATTGSPSEYQAIEETFSPKALAAVTEWILEH